MKNIVFKRILTILIASAIFIGCSKENLSANNNSSDSKGGGIMMPVHFGGLTGKLNPVPTYAGIKLFNDEQQSVTPATPDGTGAFTVMDLFPGTYRMLVVYTIPGSGEYRNYERQGIIVQSNIVTDLGVINLPME